MKDSVGTEWGKKLLGNTAVAFLLTLSSVSPTPRMIPYSHLLPPPEWFPTGGHSWSLHGSSLTRRLKGSLVFLECPIYFPGWGGAYMFWDQLCWLFHTFSIFPMLFWENIYEFPVFSEWLNLTDLGNYFPFCLDPGLCFAFWFFHPLWTISILVSISSVLTVFMVFLSI